jgi:hypothetical protein
MKTAILSSFGLALALVGVPCLASEAPVVAAPKFGTTNNSTYDVSPFDFSPVDSTTRFEHSSAGNNFILSTMTPYGAFFASPELPNGALLQGMSVYACDGNPPGGDDFLVTLEDTDTAGNFLGMVGSVTVQPSGACSTLSVDLSGQNYTVGNSHRLLVWTIFGPDPPVGVIVAVGDVTLTYKLQVSRPGLTPTFSDVPITDPAFRYVEAVAAAGITAGCGGGLFCPDSSVTRRQMAIFLSRALGLAYRFGTVMTSIEVPEWQFHPANDTVQYDDTGPPQLSRYAVSATPDPSVLQATVALPAGALLQEIEFDWCDERPAGSLPMLLVVSNAPLSGYAPQLQSLPGAGCGSSVANDIGMTVSDSKFVASVWFQSPYGDAQSRFQGARFAYQLQVSPPPAAPTFSDVPTSDAGFAYVEALAASGITGGCGGGKFCPNSPVTRRQMAVFLAKALGLNFY